MDGHDLVHTDRRECCNPVPSPFLCHISHVESSLFRYEVEEIGGAVFRVKLLTRFYEVFVMRERIGRNEHLEVRMHESRARREEVVGIDRHIQGFWIPRIHEVHEALCEHESMLYK